MRTHITLHGRAAVLFLAFAAALVLPGPAQEAASGSAAPAGTLADDPFDSSAFDSAVQTSIAPGGAAAPEFLAGGTISSVARARSVSPLAR